MKKKGKVLMITSYKGNRYSIRLSEHAEKRMNERYVDECLIISAIFSLGIENINLYKGSKCDIMITDKENDFAVVFCIENNAIIIITILESANCYVKPKTEKVIIGGNKI